VKTPELLSPVRTCCLQVHPFSGKPFNVSEVSEGKKLRKKHFLTQLFAIPKLKIAKASTDIVMTWT